MDGAAGPLSGEEGHKEINRGRGLRPVNSMHELAVTEDFELLAGKRQILAEISANDDWKRLQ